PVLEAIAESFEREEVIRVVVPGEGLEVAQFRVLFLLLEELLERGPDVARHRGLLGGGLDLEGRAGEHLLPGPLPDGGDGLVLGGGDEGLPELLDVAELLELA